MRGAVRTALRTTAATQPPSWGGGLPSCPPRWTPVPGRGSALRCTPPDRISMPDGSWRGSGGGARSWSSWMRTAARSMASRPGRPGRARSRLGTLRSHRRRPGSRRSEKTRRARPRLETLRSHRRRPGCRPPRTLEGATTRRPGPTARHPPLPAASRPADGEAEKTFPDRQAAASVNPKRGLGGCAEAPRRMLTPRGDVRTRGPIRAAPRLAAPPALPAPRRRPLPCRGPA